MILITSTGEFSFIILFSNFTDSLLSFTSLFFLKTNLNPFLVEFSLSGVVLSFSQGFMFRWNRNTTGRLVRISIPQEPSGEVGLNCDQIEPPHEGQPSHEEQ